MRRALCSLRRHLQHLRESTLLEAGELAQAGGHPQPGRGARRSGCSSLATRKWGWLSHTPPSCTSSVRLLHSQAPADELPSAALPKPAGEALEGLAAGLDPAAEGGSGSSDASDLDHIEYYPSGPGSQFVRTDALGSLQLGESLRRSAEFCGQQWQFEAGRVARLADGSCLLRVGHTTLLATAVSGRELHRRRDPLALQFDVEYREKTFAVGRIPSGYNKREGAPKEHEILAGRRVDRALRPLFPKGYAYDTQVSTSVLSADCTLDLDVAAINAASAALMCSDIPWEGPVAAVRVVMDATGKLHVNAPQEGGEAIRVKAGPRLRLMVAATQDRVVMVEAEGAQVPEAEFARALQLGAREARALLPPQLELAAACG